MTDASPRFVIYPESDGLPMTESDPTRDFLLYCVGVLERYFQGRPNVYVSGNLFIYYQEGDPKRVVSPDVFVVFGVSKRKRRSYKTWQENSKLPSFILEITSRTTQRQDEVEKPELYASLGVQEYFQYDPTGDYLQPQLKGRQLVDGAYQPLPLRTDGPMPLIHSSVLGLDLCLQIPNPALLPVSQRVPLPLELRFYDPQTEAKLMSYAELDESRQQAESERAIADQAREQAEQARRAAIPRLLGLGLTPEQVAEALGLDLDEVIEG